MKYRESLHISSFQFLSLQTTTKTIKYDDEMKTF